jgi:dTDP-4-dehydrorhamnose reductase
MIAEATAFAVKQIISTRDVRSLNGLYHLASAGVTNWHAFAEAIVAGMPEETKKCRVVEPITTPEYPTPARRPAYSVLDCGKLERCFGIRLPEWRDGLQLVLDKKL